MKYWIIKATRICPLFLGLLLCRAGIAQDLDDGGTSVPPLQMMAKPKQGGVHLRWVTSDLGIWRNGLKNGYTLSRRLVWQNGRSVKNEDFKVLAQIEPFDKEEWYALAARVDYAKVIAGYLYEEPITEKDTAVVNAAWRGRMVFMSLMADFSPEVARGLALAYVDSSTRANEAYEYRIELASGGQRQAKGLVVAGLNRLNHQFAPQKLRVSHFADSTVTLEWELHPLSLYSAYRIERSADAGASYASVSDIPFLPVNNDPQAKKIVYLDKVPTLHRTYYYRVRGIDPFGDDSAPSIPDKVYAYQTALPGPNNLSYIFEGETVHVNWEYPDSLLHNLKGFNFYHVKGGDEAAEGLNDEILGKTKPHAFRLKTKAEEQNYIFRVAAVDLRGQEIYSPPLLVALSDSTAPSPPQGLMGAVSDTGTVELCWKRSPEYDVYSYELYRAWGSSPHAFFLVKDLKWQDSLYVDSIAIRKSQREVRYLVKAVDYHVNISEASDTLVLPIPDIFPPEPPAFTFVGYTDTCVYLEWRESTSKDVIRYRMSKYYPPDSTQKALVFDVSKQDMKFALADTNYQEGVRMAYSLEAIDGNYQTSGLACLATITVPKPLKLPTLSDISLHYRKRKKSIDLAWSYKSKYPIVRFEIYRKEGLSNSRKVMELPGGQRQWVDEGVRPDTEYAYYILAYRGDGLRSARPNEYHSINTK